MPSLNGAIHDASLRFRAQILAGNRAAARVMTDHYSDAWTRIRIQVEQFLAAIAADEKAVKPDGAERAGWFAERQRLSAVQASIEAELTRFARMAEQEITLRQRREFFRAGDDVSELFSEMRRRGLPDGSLSATFGHLDTVAVDTVIGTLQDGSPLRDLMQEVAQGGARDLGQRLVTGVAAGWGARTIAASMRDVADLPRDRALTIARTEALRAYRESTTERYKAASDVLDGWIWLAGLGPRCCAACVAKHGSRHKVDEPMRSHPNCRCVQMPIVSDVEEEPIESGAEWFAQQPEKVQQAVIGTRAGMEAYKAGAVSITDFAGIHRSRAWGDSLTQRSLREILGSKAAPFYSAGKSGTGSPAARTPSAMPAPMKRVQMDKSLSGQLAAIGGEPDRRAFVKLHAAKLKAEFDDAVNAGRDPHDIHFDTKTFSAEEVAAKYTQYGHKHITPIAERWKAGQRNIDVAQAVVDAASLEIAELQKAELAEWGKLIRRDATQEEHDAHEARWAAKKEGPERRRSEAYANATAIKRRERDAHYEYTHGMLSARYPKAGRAPALVNVTRTAAADRAKIVDTMTAFMDMAPVRFRATLDGNLKEIYHSTQRAQFSRGTGTIRAPASSKTTIFHEMMHCVETGSGEQAVSRAYLLQRANGEKATRIYGGKKEFGFKDKFSNHYTGKDYGSGDTEILTMGVQGLLFGDHKMLTEDIDTAAHVLGRLLRR